jgi:hypothetical protein
LANVAAASSTSGEDQYTENLPSGSGNNSNNNFVNNAGGNDGTLTEAEVKAAAEKNKKKNEKNKKDDGSTGSTGSGAGTAGTGGGNTTPPASQSVATAAKFDPFSAKMVLFLAAFMAAVALVGMHFRGRNPQLPGSGSNDTPTG